jgi:hypothetical protein
MYKTVLDTVMSDAAVSSALQAAGAKYVDAAKRDILATLHSFRDLHPGNEMFEFPDRVRRQAFRLKGTVPVLYKVRFSLAYLRVSGTSDRML